MSTLSNLKLTNATKPTAMPPLLHRRNKLSNKLYEQIKLATAEAEGTTYTTKKIKTVKTIDGFNKTIEIDKRVRPWWFINEQGKLCVQVRYGSKLIQLAKDKTAVELTSKSDLIKTLEVIKSAIEQGELDQEIELASGKLRAGFKR